MYGVAAASVIQGFCAQMSGQAESQKLRYQASIQQNNATLALQSAKADADKQSLMSAAKIGQETASYAASGVDINTSGSVLDVLGNSAANAELDRQNILHGGEIRSINYDNQASRDQASAGNALKSSYFNALGSVAGGAFKMASYSGGGGGGSIGGGGGGYGGPNTLGGMDYSNQLSAGDMLGAYH